MLFKTKDERYMVNGFSILIIDEFSAIIYKHFWWRTQKEVGHIYKDGFYFSYKNITERKGKKDSFFQNIDYMADFLERI